MRPLIGRRRKPAARARSGAIALASLILIQAAFAQVPPVAAIDADPISRTDEPIPVPDGPRPAALADITIPPGGAGTGTRLDPSIGVRRPLTRGNAPGVAAEVVSARTEHSRQIESPNGTVTFETSAGRINYFDPNGAWQPIDLSLVEDPAGPYGLRTAANYRLVRLAAGAGTDAIAELSADGRTLRIRAARDGAATPSIDARDGVERLDYPTAASEAGLYVRPTTDGVESTPLAPRFFEEAALTVLAHVFRESGPVREQLVYEKRRFERLVQLIHRLPERGGGD